MSGIHSHQVLGMISGSSLDGLDIALVQFTIDPQVHNPILSWNIVRAETIPFSEQQTDQLKSLPNHTAYGLVETDNDLGYFFGNCAQAFIQQSETVDLISSHGHTIFHHPGRSSTQIGNPAHIAAITAIKTVADLRNMDTAYGGQGAPLAPVADKYLFPEYLACLNIGGIANISIKTSNSIVGYDICGANQFLNLYAQTLGFPYDDGGFIARSGTIQADLLNDLNMLDYCQRTPPKSLDNSEVQSMYLPILRSHRLSAQDTLATLTEHIAMQVGDSLPNTRGKVLVAGGGTFNTYLIERINSNIPQGFDVVIPDRVIIEYKEATLVALCGLLRLYGLPNSFKSITGASKDSINGVIYHP